MDFWTGIGRIARNRLAPRSLAKGYAELAGSARRAEELDYDALTVPERHFVYNGATPYPLIPLAAVARHTRRIRLTTGSFLLPLHDPLRVTQDIAVLDNLTDGRIMLGFGPGYRPIEFAGFGPPKRTRGARLMEAIELLRRALSEDEFSWRGKFFRYERVRIRPRPLQRPHPPIWLAAGTSLYAAQRAGALGFPYCLPPASFERAQENVAAYYRAAREAGVDRNGLRVAVFWPACIAGTMEEARQMRDSLLRNMADQIAFGYLVDEDGEHRYNPSPDDPFYRRYIEGIFVGTPDMAVQTIEAYERLGVHAINATFAQQDLFAREVMPHFKGRVSC